MTSRFYAPTGERMENPNPTYLRDRILNEGPDYWNTGSGDGGLDFRQGAGKTNLQLIFDESYGFNLVYTQLDGRRFVSIGPGDYEHVVSLYVGGNPVRLPSKFFVDKDLAWGAVAEFLRTGGKSSKVTWANDDELNWDYGIPN